MNNFSVDFYIRFVNMVKSSICLIFGIIFTLVVISQQNESTTVPDNFSMPTSSSNAPSHQTYSSCPVQPQHIKKKSDCVLEMTPNATRDFAETLEKQNVFIYIRLILDNTTVYQNSSTDIIDPNVWFWALQGRGFALLEYPFHAFKQLSLGTLKYRVGRVHIPVIITTPRCFQNANDEEREQILSSFITGLFKCAKQLLDVSSSEFYDGKESRNCVEIQKHNCFIHLFLPYETDYRCYNETLEPKTIKGSPLPFIFVLCIYLFVTPCFPIIMICSLRQTNLPVKLRKNGQFKKFLAINTSVPIGVKYILFHWKDDTRCAMAVRLFSMKSITFVLAILLHVLPLLDCRIRNDCLNPKDKLGLIVYFCISGVSIVFCFIFVVVVWCRGGANKRATTEDHIRKEIDTLINAIPHQLKEMCNDWTCISVLKGVIPIICNIPLFKLACMIRENVNNYLDEEYKDSTVMIFIIKLISYLVMFEMILTVCFAMHFIGLVVIYTYTGILLNYDHFSGLGIAIAGIGVFLASINVYGPYSNLFMILFETIWREDGGDKHRTEENNIRYISEEIYVSCYKELKPICDIFKSMFILIMIISVIITFSAETIKTIQKESEIPAISSMIISIVTMGIVPFIIAINSSSLDGERNTQRLKQDVEAFLDNLNEAEQIQVANDESTTFI